MREITTSYDQKFKKLDSLFAADAVGADSEDAAGPFQKVQTHFFKGQVIPITAGWFAETGRDFHKLIKVMTRQAASSKNGMSVLPLVNHDRKGGTQSIFLR